MPVDGTRRGGYPREVRTPSLDDLRARLRARSLAPIEVPAGGKRAAVGAILRAGEQGPEILLIKRADKQGDPWSGQMALPGGRHEPGDADLVQTVQRETLEEVGIDLREHGDLLARLDDVHAVARGRHVGLVIAPFVFAVRGEVELVTNGEVAEALWAPIVPLWRGEAATMWPYVHEGRRLEFPGFRVGGHVVWGLTYRMLSLLFEALAGDASTP